MLVRASSAVGICLVVLCLAMTTQVADAQSSCDNAGYCSGRGTAYVDATGQCQCQCVVPNYGFRCLFTYQTNSTGIACNGTYYSQSEIHCAAAQQACYWNTTTMQCSTRRSSIRTTASSTVSSIPWCTNFIPLPLIMIIYAFATIAFGYCCVAIVYLGRYYDAFSRVEDSGERVFNQFYKKSVIPIAYSCVIVFFSGGLAVTSWINLNDEQNCQYVFWVFLYLIVQLLPALVVIVYFLVLWIIRKCGGDGDWTFDLDKHIAPVTTVLLEHPDTNQIRCY
jgi:hypothetical protein